MRIIGKSSYESRNSDNKFQQATSKKCVNNSTEVINGLQTSFSETGCKNILLSTQYRRASSQFQKIYCVDKELHASSSDLMF
jgi:hypothetical protein